MSANDARKEASKRLRSIYDAIPPDQKVKFKPFRFHVAGRSSAQPHVFWAKDLEQATQWATIWADARGLTLEAEPHLKAVR